jgi:FtsP/CotA-like multicopper oxidase with cupredoxin domain
MRIHRLLASAFAFALVGVAVTPQLGITRGETPEGCLLPNRAMTMYVEELPRVGGAPRLGYGLTPDTASYPGPTIEMIEGECLAITVVNDVPAATLREIRDDPVIGGGDPSAPLGVSLHVHGVKYLPSSDGTFENDSIVPPGASRTYVWYAQPRVKLSNGAIGPGTAGYWWYHDHVVGTSHGTGGTASGLFGAMIVRRAEDPRPDRTYVVGMGPDATINLRKFPQTDCDPAEPMPSNTCYVAVQGELVEFAVIGFGNDFHTFHLHGHNWANNRTGLLRTTLDPVDVIDNRTLGPADTFGFTIVAGASVGPGDWMLHCHVQLHSDSGMTTFLHVLGEAGDPLRSIDVPLHRH